MASVSWRDALEIRGCKLKNRICIPPMVRFGLAREDGLVTQGHIAHYRALAEGGPGLIIQEATAVLPGGRLSLEQLGIWSEEQLPGLRQITEAVHGCGCPILVQLHHGGLLSTGPERLCPSDYSCRREKPRGTAETLQGQEMTLADIQRVKEAFVAGAVRAEQAGYDGVELHGCHSYLLCQFLNRNVNSRKDAYGDGMKLVLEMLEEIRARVSDKFLVGIRLGAFEPTLEDGIAHAHRLREAGIDFLDISYGFQGEMVLEPANQPGRKALHLAAGAIKDAVEIPVFGVDGIKTPQMAQTILEETGVDLVDVGRSALVDPAWARHALDGVPAGACLGCRDCQWRHDPSRCPGKILFAKEGNQ